MIHVANRTWQDLWSWFCHAHCLLGLDTALPQYGANGVVGQNEMQLPPQWYPQYPPGPTSPYAYTGNNMSPMFPARNTGGRVDRNAPRFSPLAVQDHGLQLATHPAPGNPASHQRNIEKRARDKLNKAIRTLRQAVGMVPGPVPKHNADLLLRAAEIIA